MRESCVLCSQVGVLCSKKCTTVEKLAIGTIEDGSGGVNSFYGPEHVKKVPLSDARHQ